MDNSLKGYKDENIITLIGKMEAGEVPYDLNDLKTFMTEATDRNLPQEHIDRLGVLIKNEILKDVVSDSNYRQNAEINYAEQFGDDEPVSPEKEEEKVEEEAAPVAEDTKVVPALGEEEIAPLEIPEEVMRAPVPEIVDSNTKEVVTIPDKLDVLEEMAVDTDIEKLREKTKKNKKKKEKKQQIKEATMNKIPVIKDAMLKKDEPKKEVIKKVEEPVIEPEEMDDDYYEFEAFPVLSFVAGFYKVFAWILFIGIIAAGLVTSIFYFIENIPLVAGIMAGCVIGGTLLLLMLYAAAENIGLKIEIERHLRRLDRK